MPPRHSVPTLTEPRYSQSLERGLAILTSFTPEQPVRRIIDIASELGMSPSTTHRYMITLEALGYVTQESSREYRLGLRVTDLGMSALNATGLRENAQPHLDQLRKDTSYTTSIAVLDGPEIIRVALARSHRRGQHLIDDGLLPGSRQPAYCTAIGKLLLAHVSQDEQRDLMAEMKLTRRGPLAITSRRALADALAKIHETGWATSSEELAAGVYAMATPVRSIDGEVIAAVDITAHSSMISLEALVDQLGCYLIAAADRLSSQLGYRRQDEVTSPLEAKSK